MADSRIGTGNIKMTTEYFVVLKVRGKITNPHNGGDMSKEHRGQLKGLLITKAGKMQATK